MSSEVCPFCGKTYKRLKSHLPHCKAAASSKTPPANHDVTANQTTSPSQLTAATSKPTAKAKKSTQTLSVAASPQSKKSKKVSPAPPQPSSPATSSSQSLSLSSASLPPSTKKKKQKLSEQIKMANMTSSNTIPLISSPSLSVPPNISEPKKKSLHALIEAAKSKQVSKGSLEGTRSASEDLPSGSTPFVADPLSSRTTAQTETKTNPSKDLVEDNARPAFPSADTKPKDSSKTKASKTKKAAQSRSTTKDTSSSLDSKVNESSARPRLRDNFWLDNKGEVEDLSVNEMLLQSGSGHQARITLQDVKSTLGRTNAARQSSRKSILTQIETADHLSSKIRLPLQTGNQEGVDSCQQTVSMNEGLKVGHHVTGLNTVSSTALTQFPSPHLFPLAPKTPPARVETWRAADGLTMEKSQLEVRKQNTADNGTKGALPLRTLGQVRLRELPEWLACKTPGHPRDVVGAVQRGWQWYYKRYIDVKKGRVGGLGMLLAGYCVLSYTWSYPHIKRDRWRKYH